MNKQIIEKILDLYNHNDIFNNNINSIDATFEQKEIIKNISIVISDNFFATKFLTDSKFYNSASFSITIKEKDFHCYFYYSTMIHNDINMLIGKVNDMDFIVSQYVSSCDFIYFPSVNYYFEVGHAQITTSMQRVKKLAELIKNDLNIDGSIPAEIKGIILSHSRPYHFFYDIAPMVEKLFINDLLTDFDHYQVEKSNYINFSKLYKLDVDNHIASDFSSMNKLIPANSNKVLFKVGLNYNLAKKNIRDTIFSFDHRIADYSIHDAENLDIVNKFKKLNEENTFILWFGICSEKRSLKNQVELLFSLIDKLKMFHLKFYIVLDGWTNTDTSSNNTIDDDDLIYREIISKYQKDNIYSLIGAKSSKKIAISQYVDFHISSGTTGSMWPSRFARKKGILHSSKAFYPVQLNHIHYNDIDYPNYLVEDYSSDRPTADFVSYKINKDDFLNFINTNYPNIFNADYKLDRFKVLSNANIDCIDKQKNTYSSVNNDPQVYLNVDSLIDLEYPYTLNIVVYISYDSNIGNKALTFYLNYGDGFNSNDIVSLSTESFSDRAELNILIEKPLIGIRFDPINAEVDFQLKGLFYKIKKVL